MRPPFDMEIDSIPQDSLNIALGTLLSEYAEPPYLSFLVCFKGEILKM